MSKKKDKKKDKSKDDSARTGAVDAVEALRAVVERTFAEGAQSTRERAADIVTEVAQAAASVRGSSATAPESCWSWAASVAAVVSKSAISGLSALA